MVANQTECSGYEQRLVIKYFVIENCKPYEIYTRMRDVYGKACFSKKKKMFTNRLNMGLLPLLYIDLWPGQAVRIGNAPE